MIVTPKDILDSILEGETKPLSLKPWENKTQCVLFTVSVGALNLGFLCARNSVSRAKPFTDTFHPRGICAPMGRSCCRETMGCLTDLI